MMLTITSQEMKDVLYALFKKYEFTESKAHLLADVFTQNTLYGVNSHGINRVPFFIETVKKGIVKIDKEAKKVEAFGSIERWDGHQGPGIINAITCTNRAIALAKKSGMGLVALRNTNHWMRGGYYGWQAANENCIGILFTNTQPNMPAWGGKESRIGNNPFIVSIPRKEGHIVLDMALSQFSFGKINNYKLKGEQLPYHGGWDENHKLSRNPEEILKTEQGLPIGYWKGSAFSIVLDMIATLLSAGNSTYRIGLNNYETAISQIYLCICPEIFPDKELQQALINEIINYTHDATPTDNGNRTYYPGERSANAKKYNTKNGMNVNTEIWKKVLSLLKEE
ncbi:3-dehydro-L-gulonate 2-dehydrogenase [Seonamhaeicola aphaedonensis]|uniref:3-dehydro-L-gulonate 2-dehydrogenase n=1 Tax=Seonamhaeicola aphaedonensis TaxID=1461338 RepID=A0A3D9HHR3_9FLAO|nr:3-dehydro-L-gulonate 2-dehydrogenase [Seonamhaeicola aphaedonensis]RED49010.1 3-dehydro-L-gulonate 2-dehydrogenase [Seonamhaeicola aphaedonensis]